MSKLILLIEFLIASAVLVGISLPLIFGWIAPNRWYGFRTRRTLADPKTWYAANAESGQRLAAAGLTIAVGAVLFFFAPSWQMLHYAIAMLAVTVFALGWALLQSAMFLKKLEPEEKPKLEAIDPETNEPDKIEGDGEEAGQYYARWTNDFARVVAGTLRELQSQLSTPIQMVAVDCHPWHGSLGLSFLTQEESEDNPQLCDAAEMAAWQHHNFGVQTSAWAPVAGLAREMKRQYERADDRAAVADGFLRSCADAMSTKVVQEELQQLILTENFRISVANPDDGHEYFA